MKIFVRINESIYCVCLSPHSHLFVDSINLSSPYDGIPYVPHRTGTALIPSMVVSAVCYEVARLVLRTLKSCRVRHVMFVIQSTPVLSKPDITKYPLISKWDYPPRVLNAFIFIPLRLYRRNIQVPWTSI